jgi:processive 1,2-diacylglycerol beta-glucosyltransferase
MRVLIATVTAGAGHLAAARALEESWKSLRPKDTIQTVDVLDFAPKLIRKFYVDGYVKLVEAVPELYAYAFKKSDDPAKLARTLDFRRSLSHKSARGFAKLLAEFQPDVVLCPHYLPLEIIGHLRSKQRLDTRAVCIVTDFEAHSFWLEPSADLVCVAADETGASMAARGMDPAKIVVTGIPIGSKFSQPIDRLEVRRRYGLRDDIPTLLVLGGGFGMGPVAEILAELDKVPGHFQTLVVAGRNEALRRELAVQDRTHATDVLGFSKNMHELMTVSDLIITKPGGLTSSEALALGKPLFILNPIPGQEAANSDFLLSHGAAFKANRVQDLGFQLKKLLGSARLAQTAAAAKDLGQPDAARAVCEATLAMMANKPAAA